MATTELPILSSLDIEAAESFESRALARGQWLAAWTRFEPTKAPLLLIHGTGDSPARFARIVEALAPTDRPILFALYDDTRTPIERSALGLAHALQRLNARYPRGVGLDIVAHSMGGIVARACLNELQDPSSRADRSALEPRAGFGPIRLRSIDTPWDGYDGPNDDVFYDILGPIRFFIPGAVGSMRASSALFRGLFSIPLAGVRFANIQAMNGSAKVRSVCDLTPNDRLQLIRRLIRGTRPESARLLNMARSIEHDERFDQLRAALWSAIQRRQISETRADETRELSNLYAKVYPTFRGSHESVVANPALIRYLTDHLIAPE